ncbi:MAG: response regulator [Pseudanabaenaceae cyanobacterium bins.68]|nr:response regulator [Pseudanabaenaceae cyanobacterium bins.68]
MKQIVSKPGEVVQAISARSLSGCLTISHPQLPNWGWQLFLGEGRLHYATICNQNQIERLRCLWQNLPWALPHPDFSNQEQEANDYELLCNWKQQYQISIANFRKLLIYLSREALIQAFSYDRVLIRFQPNHTLKQVLVAAPIIDLIKPSLAEIRYWKAMRKILLSPLSKISLEQKQLDQFCAIWDRVMPTNQAELAEQGNTPGKTDQTPSITMSTWIRLLLDGHNLYHLAYQSEVSPMILTKWLQPYLEQQILTVSNAEGVYVQPAVVKSYKPMIACVDDSKSVQRQVTMILEMAGFEVVSITEPATSLTILADQVPQLILMDVSMPEIDGYELSAMLRRSPKLKDIPIIMLTSRDGIIDRLRAQLIGAVDYLTKPVQPDKLIAKVQQFYHSQIAS